MPVQVGVHLVLEGRGFAFALARRNGGGVSRVVEQAGGRQRFSFCGGVPVTGDGRGGGGGGKGGGGRRRARRRRGRFGQRDEGRGRKRRGV